MILPTVFSRCLKASTLWFALLISQSASAALIQISYEATFKNSGSVPIFGEFGTTQVTVNLVIDTSLPIVIVPAGSAVSLSPGDTWGHAAYGYSADALSLQSFTYGEQIWGADDRIVAPLSPDFAAAAIWFDQPLSVDGTPRILTAFDNNGGIYALGTFFCDDNGTCLFNDNAALAVDNSVNFIIDSSSVNIEISAVPIPASIWMFGAAIALFVQRYR